MATGTRELFGLGVVAAYLRGNAISLSTTRVQNIVLGIANAFGLGDDSYTLYYFFKNNQHLNGTIGFGVATYYNNYELDVAAVINNSYPSESQINRDCLTVTAHAFIWAYTVVNGMTLEDLSDNVGNALYGVADTANQHQIFQKVKEKVIHPFTAAVIKVLLNKDYSKVVTDLVTSPKDDQAPLVNYNWYDVSPLYSGPNLQIMKDIENQYFYLSGQMVYGSDTPRLADCIEDTIVVNTEGGPVTTTFIRNTPCISKDSYIGPPTGVSFYRVFNDGPSSSGDFSTSVKAAYQEFDRHILHDHDWQSNALQLLSFETGADGNFVPIYSGPVFMDSNGRYSLDFEYQYAPAPSGCGGLARMHIGDNLPRRIAQYNLGICTGSYTGLVTGFKVVSLEIDGKAWNQNLTYFRGNPVDSTGFVFKRSLNIDPNPYLATASDGVYLPYVTDPDTFQQKWYIGPPQLSGGNSLPSIGFFQRFDSPTFDDHLQLVMYPTISHSFGGTGALTRTYEIASVPLLSGESSNHHTFTDAANDKITFNQTFNSNLTGRDDIAKKFFGMGDGLTGGVTITKYPAENAGFFYTGYTAYLDGNPISIFNLITQYDGYKLGSPIKTFRYIKGYQNPLGDMLVTKVMGQDSSGNKVPYYYLDNRIISTPFVPTNWDWFAPIPTDLEANYLRIYEEQRVENYLPRYYRGPFSVQEERFLYPNAKQTDIDYMGKLHGFPRKLTFDVEVREETVKEIFATYEMGADGVLATNPNYIRVIRAFEGGVDLISLTPTMRNIFIPNDPGFNNGYDFNNWNIGADFSYVAGLDAVDNRWTPLVSGITASARNNVTYNRSIDLVGTDSSLFFQGIIKTGYQGIEHRIYTGHGPTDYRQEFDEKPIGVGLYHGYKSMKKAVALYYVPPIFDLGSGTMVVTPELIKGFDVIDPAQASYGAVIEPYTGANSNMVTGLDPFFFEYVGGRRGGDTAAQEGGYHSQGIIGDQWEGMAYNTYGTTRFLCFPPIGNAIPIWHRYPKFDDTVLMFNTTQTGTTIWTRGLSFNPFKVDAPTRKFTNNVTVPYSWEFGTGTITTSFVSGFLQFDLGNFFQYKTGSGWYSTGGLKIGPFDRDVEFGLTGDHKIVANTEFYVNGVQLSRIAFPDNCSTDYVRGITINTGIVLGEFGRDSTYSIFAKIPSGQSAYMNVFSTGYDDYSYPVPTGMGLASGAIVNIRAFIPNFASLYDPNLHKGEANWLNPFLFVKNGLEKKYEIPHTNLKDIEGTYSYITYSQSGIYYPTPSGDFTGLATQDSFGNMVYAPNVNVQSYWRQKAIAQGRSITFSGWREGSRISIKIKNFKESFDTIPYQSYVNIVPSGYCTLSGEMGYKAQADNTVFTEGFHMVNVTENDITQDVYNPEFISDVIKRIPNYASGTGVLRVAPSVMKQRVDISGISINQEYEGLLSEPPYHYNKPRWPALSDLETLNPGETLEQIPPDDGLTFILNPIMFSASQGQDLPNGLKNPNIIKRYGVKTQYQMYDSIATDALINSGKCITSLRGTRIYLSQADMSGAVTSMGNTLTMISKGLR